MVILGILITFLLALIGVVFSTYLFFRLNGVEQTLEGLKQQNSETPNQSPPANKTSNPAPSTSEAKPSSTPTPSLRSAESPTPSSEKTTPNTPVLETQNEER